MFTFFFLKENHVLLYYISFVCLCVDYKYKKINQLLITAATEQENMEEKQIWTIMKIFNYKPLFNGIHA